MIMRNNVQYVVIELGLECVLSDSVIYVFWENICRKQKTAENHFIIGKKVV